MGALRGLDEGLGQSLPAPGLSPAPPGEPPGGRSVPVPSVDRGGPEEPRLPLWLPNARARTTLGPTEGQLGCQEAALLTQRFWNARTSAPNRPCLLETLLPQLGGIQLCGPSPLRPLAALPQSRGGGGVHVPSWEAALGVGVGGHPSGRCSSQPASGQEFPVSSWGQWE